jgi:hypothetical protein
MNPFASNQFKICGYVSVGRIIHPLGCVEVRKGLEGRGAATA